MHPKKCCVSPCKSSTSREQDKGVTFHRLPKNYSLRSQWQKYARLNADVAKNKLSYVCSRHFRKVDFESQTPSIYTLKSGATPTIFPWGVTPLEAILKPAAAAGSSKDKQTSDDPVTARLSGNKSDEDAVTKEPIEKDDQTVGDKPDIDEELVNKARLADLINDAKSAVIEVACLNTTPKVCIESIGDPSPRKKRKLIRSASTSKLANTALCGDKKETAESSSNVDSDVSNVDEDVKDNNQTFGEKVGSSEAAAKKSTGRLSLRNKKSIVPVENTDKSVEIKNCDEVIEVKKEVLEMVSKTAEEISNDPGLVEIKKEIKISKDLNTTARLSNRKRLKKSPKVLGGLLPKVKRIPRKLGVKSPKGKDALLNVVQINIPRLKTVKNDSRVVSKKPLVRPLKRNRQRINRANVKAAAALLSENRAVKIQCDTMDDELLFNAITENMNESLQRDIDLKLNITTDELKDVSVTKVEIDEDDSDATLPGNEGVVDDPNLMDERSANSESEPPNIGTMSSDFEENIPVSRVDKIKSSPMLKALIEKTKSPMTRPRTKLPGSWQESSPPSRKQSQKYSNPPMSSDSKGMLVQGTRVEAKDFNGCWYVARIVEVDQEEMEVLIHYDNWSQRYDEWISMSSPRLRLIEVPVTTPTTEPPYYQVGERCLARWSDNRRFPATIRKVLPNGRYEVIFDDSFIRTLKWPMISKVRSLDCISSPGSDSAPNVTSPVPYGTRKSATLSAPPDSPAPLPIHNHLFDPSRDHLGSKEERRDMKRRLNVKELFSAKKKGAAVPPRNRVAVKPDALKVRKKRTKPIVMEDVKPSLLDIKVEPASEPEPPKTPMTPATPNIIDQSPATELLKDEWCCRWVGGQPVGEMSKRVTGPSGNPIADDGTSTGLERISVKVEDHRLPPGWMKQLTRRSIGESAGKWDVVLICPSGRRFRTRAEMRTRFLEADHVNLMPYSNCLMDFSVHRKLSRRLGWDTGEAGTPAARKPRTPKVIIPPVESVPLVVTNEEVSATVKTDPATLSVSSPAHSAVSKGPPVTPLPAVESLSATPLLPLEDGYVYVGSLKVQIIENLLRCPQEGCFKNFRKDNLLQMHIKHYHTELQKFLGDTPNVADLAYARTIVEEVSSPKSRNLEEKITKTKEKKQSLLTPKIEFDLDTVKQEERKTQSPLLVESKIDPMSPARTSIVNLKELETSPKLRNALLESVKVEPQIKPEPKINTEATNVESGITFTGSTLQDLLMSTSDKTVVNKDTKKADASNKGKKLPTLMIKKSTGGVNQKNSHKVIMSKMSNPTIDSPMVGNNDAIVKKEEPVISSPQLHLTPRFNTNAVQSKLKKPSNKRSSAGSGSFPVKKKRYPNNKLDVWEAFTGDHDETRSSLNVPDTSVLLPAEDVKPILEHAVVEPTKTLEEDATYDINQLPGIIGESGENIKIVHMKREEIINCDCRYGEEDGLMLQCELCLCWQHGICYNIERESQVPEKYICRICQNPLRGRKSQSHLNDQEWLYEGTLPRINPLNNISPPRYVPLLKKSHELSGNLLQLQGLMHALRCKMDVAEKKDHPKLYLWSKPWEDSPLVLNDIKSDSDTKQSKKLEKKIKDEVNQESTFEEISIDEIKIEDVSQNGITLSEDNNESSMDDGIPKCDNEIELSTSEIPIEECMEMQVIQANGDQVNMGMVPVAEETIVTTKDHIDMINKEVNADGVVSQASATAILANLLLSPGGTPIHLPITNSELETLAKSVQNSAPQPEAAIDSSECRMRLYQHVERTQLLLDARLDSIEAQIAELESQDPSLEDDETAEFYPRTKQTIQMLLRDLATMEELGMISSC